MLTKVLMDSNGEPPYFTITDRIFLGEGLFETLRVTSAKPCFAPMHWQRLSDAAHQLGIPFDLSLDAWIEHLEHQIKSDNLYHGGIKAILSGGTAIRGLAEQGQNSQIIFQSFNYKLIDEPLKLISASWLRDKSNPIYQVKSVNYLEAISARRHALAQNADDALFFNTEQCATETTCANLFVLINDILYTPSIEQGVLPGITRLRILQLCQAHHIAYKEAPISKEMITKAQAFFTTNSLQGICQVQSFDGITFDTQMPLVLQLIEWLE